METFHTEARIHSFYVSVYENLSSILSYMVLVCIDVCVRKILIKRFLLLQTFSFSIKAVHVIVLLFCFLFQYSPQLTLWLYF